MLPLFSVTHLIIGIGIIQSLCHTALRIYYMITDGCHHEFTMLNVIKWWPYFIQPLIPYHTCREGRTVLQNRQVWSPSLGGGWGELTKSILRVSSTARIRTKLSVSESAETCPAVCHDEDWPDLGLTPKPGAEPFMLWLQSSLHTQICFSDSLRWLQREKVTHCAPHLTTSSPRHDALFGFAFKIFHPWPDPVRSLTRSKSEELERCTMTWFILRGARWLLKFPSPLDATHCPPAQKMEILILFLIWLV